MKQANQLEIVASSYHKPVIHFMALAWCALCHVRSDAKRSHGPREVRAIF